WRETGCDGILIGRGAMANPWIFRQIEDTLNGQVLIQPTLEDKRKVLLEYFTLLNSDMPEIAAMGRMKQLAGHFTRGLPGGARFRTAIYHSHEVSEILGRIEEYFEAIMSGRPYFGEDANSLSVEDAIALPDACEVLVV
ncbi:MAG: tRNA-dihydrouridine synthase, partial [Pyrinomonadaceae bacterium]